MLAEICLDRDQLSHRSFLHSVLDTGIPLACRTPVQVDGHGTTGHQTSLWRTRAAARRRRRRRVSPCTDRLSVSGWRCWRHERGHRCRRTVLATDLLPVTATLRSFVCGDPTGLSTSTHVPRRAIGHAHSVASGRPRVPHASSPATESESAARMLASCISSSDTHSSPYIGWWSCKVHEHYRCMALDCTHLRHGLRTGPPPRSM